MRALTVTLLLLAFSVTTASAADYDYRTVSKVPCAGFVALYKTDLFDVVRDPVVQYVTDHPLGAALGSGCNITDYVLKTCFSHPKMTIGGAVADLFAKVRSHAALPAIGQCGA